MASVTISAGSGWSTQEYPRRSNWEWAGFVSSIPTTESGRWRRWKAAVEDRGIYDLEYRLRRFDGVYRWFKTRGTTIRDDQDNIIRWFGTCTDIEDQKQAEEALRDADRKKDEFLAMLAHELRNPLASIGNAAHLLGSRDAQAHFPWVKEVISRQVKQLGQIDR